MSKCEYINLVLDSEFNSDEMYDSLELLEDECSKCESPCCIPEEVKEIESLVDVIEEMRQDETEEVCNCEECTCEDEKGSDAESLLVLQEIEKENLRLDALYSEIEIEETDLNVKAKQEAEALGVFFRTLVGMGMNTTEAYNTMIQKMTCENNLEVTKINQVAAMQNQI